jgi:hypothetical protein
MAPSTPNKSPVPEESPLHPFRFLETGWDGYWAAPLPEWLLVEAHQFWEILKSQNQENDLPVANASANGAVAFTWRRHYPVRELEVWLYGKKDCYAEWMISGIVDEEGVSASMDDLLTLFNRYQEPVGDRSLAPAPILPLAGARLPEK